MSNGLKRKKPKMQPYGYGKKELDRACQRARLESNTEKLIEDSYLNLKLIAYQILHDKFGFGQKRISRVDATVDSYLASASNGGTSTNELQYYLESKCGIDVKTESNKVPFRERFAITTYKINADSKQSAGMYILASICNYFSLLGVCLKTQFKFSKNSIEKVFWHIRDYINTLSRFKQFELKIEDIAVSVAEECKFCDRRFIGGKT
jgi:hypothetical protein